MTTSLKVCLVEEPSEARKPKGQAIISEVDGQVEITENKAEEELLRYC